MEMYFLRPWLVHHMLAQTTNDHMTVCHAGHGTNSYTVNYCLAYRELLLFAQVSWGGIYMNNADLSAIMAGIFQDCQKVITLAQAQTAHTIRAGSRLLIIWSTTRGKSARCGWIAGDSSPEDSHQVPLIDSGSAVTVAEHLLQQRPTARDVVRGLKDRPTDGEAHGD